MGESTQVSSFSLRRYANRNQAEMAGRFLFQKLSSRMSRSSEPVARLASVWVRTRSIPAFWGGEDFYFYFLTLRCLNFCFLLLLFFIGEISDFFYLKVSEIAFCFQRKDKVLIFVSLFQEGSIRIHNHVPAAHHTTVAPHLGFMAM